MKCNKTGIEVNGGLADLIGAMQDEIIRLREESPFFNFVDAMNYYVGVQTSVAPEKKINKLTEELK